MSTSALPSLLLLITSVLTIASCKKENSEQHSSIRMDSVGTKSTELSKKLQASIDSITPCKIFETHICISIDVTEKTKREALLSSITEKLRENNSPTNYTVLIYNRPEVIACLKQTKENYPVTSEDYKVELTNYEGRNTASHFTLGKYYLFLGENANAAYTAAIDTALMKQLPNIILTTNRFTYLFPHQQNFRSVYFECITGTNSASLQPYGSRVSGFFTPYTASVTILNIQTENMTEGIERNVPEDYR